jgi:hypothetical protein
MAEIVPTLRALAVPIGDLRHHPENPAGATSRHSSRASSSTASTARSSSIARSWRCLRATTCCARRVRSAGPISRPPSWRWTTSGLSGFCSSTTARATSRATTSRSFPTSRERASTTRRSASSSTTSPRPARCGRAASAPRGPRDPPRGPPSPRRPPPPLRRRPRSGELRPTARRGALRGDLDRPSLRRRLRGKDQGGAENRQRRCLEPRGAPLRGVRRRRRRPRPPTPPASCRSPSGAASSPRAGALARRSPG